jgi:hypothetical protein
MRSREHRRMHPLPSHVRREIGTQELTSVSGRVKRMQYGHGAHSLPANPK